QQSPARARRRGHRREDLARHAAEAVLDERVEDRAEKEQADGGREPREAEREDIGELTDRVALHTEESARRSRRSSMKRAAAITEKVMRKSSAPSAMSAEV